MVTFLGILGAVSLLYYVIIVVYAGIDTAFSVFWLILGLLCLAGMIFFRGFKWFPKWKTMLVSTRVFVQTTAIFAAAVFFITEGLILGTMLTPPSGEADYIIVIGSKISGNQSAPTMERCLESALDYLKDHPDTKVIVSGEESNYNNLTQAEIMQAWLLAHGIKRERIYPETAANSVQENITNSYEIIKEDWEGDGTPKLAVVTMNFHVFRARLQAQELLGLPVETIPSKADPILEMNYMAREFFCVIGDKMMGMI